VAKPKVGTVGYVITITGLGTITDAATHDLHVLKPGATDAVTWASTIGTDNASLTYTTIAGDFSVPGEYIIEPYIVLTGVWTGHCDAVRLRVWESEAD
jgi:hypothetical protein